MLALRSMYVKFGEWEWVVTKWANSLVKNLLSNGYVFMFVKLQLVDIQCNKILFICTNTCWPISP